jgi:hypothetical protein
MALLPGSPAIAAGGLVAALPGAISATATTITFPALAGTATVPGDVLFRIDGEQMLVTGVSSEIVTVIRGYNGTTAAAHNTNAPIYLATDQRGDPRDNSPDLGAFQTQLGTASAPGSSPGANQPPPAPPPSQPPSAYAVVLLPRRIGKRTKLVAKVSFTGGRPPLQVVAPYQKPAFQAIVAALQDLDGDGLFESLVFTARKGKRHVRTIVYL